MRTMDDSLFRLIFEGHSAVMLLIDPHSGKILKANRAAERFYGHSMAKLSEMRIQDINLLSAREVEKERQRAWLEKRNRFIFPHRLAGGECRTVEVHSSPISIDGTPILFSIIHDITERKQAEDALKEAKQSLERGRNVLQEVMNGARNIHLLYLDSDFNFVRVNEAYAKGCGYSPDEMIGKNHFALYPHEENEAIFRRVRDTGQPFEVKDKPFTFPDQPERGVTYWDWSLTPVKAAGGEVEGLVFALVETTGRKRAELALRESSEKLVETLRVAKLGHYSFDSVGGRWTGSPQLDDILELGGSAGGDADGWLRLVHPDDVEEVRRGLLLDALEHDQLFDCEFRVFTHQTATEKWVQGRGRRQCDEQGRTIGVFGTIQDVTEGKRAEMEIHRMQKLESLGTIAGGIAHDFNNLLMGIFGNLEMAGAGLPPETKAAAYLREAQNAMAKAKQLTGQLLTFAKGGSPVLEAVATASLVRDTVDFNLRGSAVSAQFTLPPNLLSLEADEGQVGQMIANLTINARQAMPRGGKLYVEAANVAEAPQSAEGQGERRLVSLTFRDEGPGIPPENMERIFDPYFTTKSAGHGLGLAIVHSIVIQHGGRIEVDSVAGKGTTFTVHLPAVAGDASRPVDADAPADDRKPARALRILLMDDQEMIRKVGTQLIQHLGHAIETAADGGEAIAKHAEARDAGHPFDLVIMDLTIPGGMGGQEAVRELRQRDPGICVIAASGYASDPILADYRAYGFSGRLVKPFELAVLRTEIARVMEGDSAPGA